MGVGRTLVVAVGGKLGERLSLVEASGLCGTSCVACLLKYSSRGGVPVLPAPLQGFLKAVVRMSLWCVSK